jgi:branched-chain amino acid transport system permease protein
MATSSPVRALNLLGQPRVYLSLGVLAVAALFPVFLSSTLQNMLILTFIIGTGAIAWNIIGGYGGQFSLGNGVFFGASAYTLTILLTNLEQGLIVAFSASILVTLLIALVIGYPAFRLRSHYFALATIVVVEGFRFLVRHFRDFTGGERGISVAPARVRGVPLLDLTGGEYYLLGLALFAGAALLSAYIRYSKLGYYLMAIRDDQQAAAAVGIDTAKYKMYGWLVSAFLTGLAGVMYALYVQYLSPNFMFGITQSVLLAVIPIIGGVGTITGPVIGALLMWPLLHIVTTQYGGQYGAVAYMGYGTILILMIMYAPDGIVAQLKARAARIEQRLPIFTVGDSNPKFGWN